MVKGEWFNQLLFFMGLFVHIILGLYEHNLRWWRWRGIRGKEKKKGKKWGAYGSRYIQWSFNLMAEIISKILYIKKTNGDDQFD